MLKVRAEGDEGKVVGYCDHIRRRGKDEFVLSDVSKFSSTYMIELDKEAFAEAREVVAKLKAKLNKLGVEFAELATTKVLVVLLGEAEKAAAAAPKKEVVKKDVAVDREVVKARLKELEVQFAGNLSTDKLVVLLKGAEKAKAEIDKTAGEGEGSQEADKE